MNDNIRIVLVETTHPGNIGGAARAMKNMGLSHLYLVKPRRFPDDEAIARSSGADDILAAAQVVDSLAEALEGCQLAFATTARLRTLEWPQYNPRQAASRIAEASREGSVAIVFGRESSGLSNEELQLCHYLVHIPCNPEYSSLNLAAAVQVLSYEIFQAGQDEQASEQSGESTPVSHDELQRYYEHLEQVLISIDFLNPEYPKKLMGRLRRLYNRAQPDQREINILRGILSAVEKLKSTPGGQG